MTYLIALYVVMLIANIWCLTVSKNKIMIIFHVWGSLYFMYQLAPLVEIK